MTVEITIL